MPIYKPSELHEFLESLGIKPKKALSQNFLIDGNILKKIVAAADANPEDLIVEIGPGPGSLTEILLQTGAQVIAVEKDEKLAKALERLQADKRLHIYCGDILDFPLEQVLADFLKPGQKGKVIANLPYHLTTPILVKLVSLNKLFSDLFVMVQEEVARRFTAQPGSSEYSSFTIFLNYHSSPKYNFKVSRNSFYPSPKVDSAVVTFHLQNPPKVSDEELFFKLTRTSFEHRRKMLRSSLKEFYPPQSIMDVLEHLGKSPQARPEELSLEDFLKFFELLNPNR